MLNLRSTATVLGVAGVLLAALLFALPGGAAPKQAPFRWCRLQKPQQFLERPYYVVNKVLHPKRHDRALRYRVEHYGHLEGLGLETLNTAKVSSKIISTRFFGLPISIHASIAPALRCVERRIQKVCTRSSDRYSPRAVGGVRHENSIRGGEVSNHLFGIAIDIDPDRNPCCGCVSPWPDHPACRGQVETVMERTALPSCWIRAFERYGFYWLGKDPQLRDTMHFEFLADPKRIIPKW